jgi:acyl carrier protein
MELQEFVNHFAEQFEETEAAAFTPETIFRDLDEWSSLISLSVIAMVDEEYGIALKGADMREAETIQDLFNIVQAKLA